jgi:hypothetical protein
MNPHPLGTYNNEYQKPSKDLITGAILSQVSFFRFMHHSLNMQYIPTLVLLKLKGMNKKSSKMTDLFYKASYQPTNNFLLLPPTRKKPTPKPQKASAAN